ncbi:nucleolar pre-ribosomal-associated protein 1 [Entelurus aequoreus]|uniref:nucleolar pre-ribosomal-associated protein 1 n=1 Tax=Entelurus aequoreus TaxID=161455 RepID=UPI002B1D7A2B|nr:nucleolar pre-ribosomal-associated protein 1 [Entelurus aequoreus]XP_061916835.1 nucleolar pre-ribosomal-associated protein 1 [Entelurus aequoreus]
MSRKRCNKDAVEHHVAAKKEKFSEFNGTVFKSMLKDPTQAMKGLETFIDIARKLPSPQLYDVVEGYVKISMECAEIFQLLEGDKQIESEMLLIFESLEVILLRTASDLSHFRMVGNAIVKKTVSSHMRMIQGCFQSRNHRLVRLSLNLLSASISQGPEAAREVLSYVYINKTLTDLVKWKDRKGKPDVRMAFIQFVLAFLVSGDSATIGRIIEIKEFLPTILSTGLKEDRMSIVNLILSTLKTKVLFDKAISKTQKVRLFTAATISHIASLYKWNGIVDATAGDEGDSDPTGITVVRKLVHSFLLDLCCSRKHGIPFHDASFGTAGRAGNIILLQFLVGLKQATEDELVAQLAAQTLRASPDVVTRYFKETRHWYTPRPNSAWQDTVGLLKKIYEAQPGIGIVFQANELIPIPRLLSMILAISLPPVCTKAFFKQGMSLANTAAQLTTFSTISFILKKADTNAAFLLEYRSDVYTPEIMGELLQQYREMLSKILPDMTNIVERWQSHTKKESETDQKVRAKQTNKNNKVSVPETPEVILLKALILQVICLYQKVVPHLVSQCKFDFSKFLKGVVSEGGVNQEVAPVLQHQILQLALDIPASKFSWFRLQEASQEEKSVIYLLLKMFVNSGCSQLKTSTRMLVVKVLKDTGVFEYTWTELELWLDQLDRVEPSQQETAVRFLEQVFARVVSHSHMYTDKVASLVQEAAELQSNLSGPEGDAASVAVSHIDDVLDMLDVIMEGNDANMEEDGPPLSQDSIVQMFPFSVAVLAALEARNKLPANKGVAFEYLYAVLCHILHSQREPLPLCLGLLQYDKDLASSEPPVSPHGSVAHLQRYYSRWLPQQCREELLELPECQPKEMLTSFTALMKAAYLDGLSGLPEDSFRKDVEEAAAALSVADFPLAIKQILLYVKSTVEDFGTFPQNTGCAILKTLMEILQDVLSRLQGWQVSTDPEPAEQSYQEGSDLFLEVNQSSTGEANKEQMLLSALTSIFRHPCLEQWYLALELSTLPPHSLNPVRLKAMCTQLSDGIVTLLTMAAATLCELGHLELLVAYTGAVEKAVRKELLELSAQTPVKLSRPFQALLALHSYMDPLQVRDLVSELLLLPQERLVISAARTQPSVYGQAALQILTESTARRDQERGTFLSQAHLRGLGTLLLSCSSPALEAFLLQMLTGEPASAQLIHSDVLVHCLQHPLPHTLAIGCLLLKNCSTQRLFFETWCLQPDNANKLSDMMEDFLPLIGTYLQVATNKDPTRPQDVQKEVSNALKERLLAKLIQSALGDATEDAVALEALAALIKLSADVADIRDLMTDLPAALQKVDSSERWKLVDVITEKLADSPEEGDTWRKSITSAALKCLIASYKDQPTAITSIQEQNILERLQRLVTSPDAAADNWNSFVQTGLKYRYRNQHFLNTLRSLLEGLYHPPAMEKGLLPLSTLHMMASSHSLFLPTMLDPDDDDDPSRSQTKEALVSLLFCLVKKCPQVCDMSHFLVLLGAYGATLSTTDQTILLLLREYEKNHVSLLKFQSVLWGAAAVEHHKTRKSLGSSLWKQTHSDDILALLNADKMLQTVVHFPQERRIIPKVDEEMLFHQNNGDMYDPSFLLPLFSFILGPESVVDCRKFISVHALGLTVVALSSSDPNVRAAAYHVLTCFYHHLEAARIGLKEQLLYLLDMLKNGIRKQNKRIPFVLTIYISKVVQLMLKPEDQMYLAMNRFLLSRQSLDLWRLPTFFRFFYGFDPEHKKQREWILSLLEEGLIDGHCYDLCNQQGLFQSLLGFSSSPLCDDDTQRQIIKVLCQSARVVKAAYELGSNNGLLSWLIQMVEKRNLEQHLLDSVIDMLHTLWFTNVEKKEKALEQIESSSLAETKVKCLPLTLINEFQCLALSVSRRLRLGVKAAQFSLFLQTLTSILKHQVTALRVAEGAQRLVFPPQPLSTVNALALLLCWTSLSGHTALLGQIQGLCEKHRLKELLTTGKDRIRAKIFHARAKKAKLVEEAETAEQKPSLPTECRLFLSNILMYWRPVLAATARPPKDAEHPGVLAVQAAHLVTKWVLGCLVEDAYDKERTKRFLLWLEDNVLRQEEMVDILLPDAGFQADLLRLYHRVCQATVPGATESFRLFTDIMIRLLERRGKLPEKHGAIVSACRPEDAKDQWKREAGLSLLSLYIHEVWSGHDSAQLFLSHVAMVTGDSHKRGESGKAPQTESAIRDVCRDLMHVR